jgi:hypothetical protein
VHFAKLHRADIRLDSIRKRMFRTCGHDGLWFIDNRDVEQRQRRKCDLCLQCRYIYTNKWDMYSAKLLCSDVRLDSFRERVYGADVRNGLRWNGVHNVNWRQ